MNRFAIAVVVLLGFALVAEQADAHIFPLFGRRFVAGGNVVRVPGSIGRAFGVRTRVNGVPIRNRFVSVHAPFVSVNRFNGFGGVAVRAPFVNVNVGRRFVSPVSTFVSPYSFGTQRVVVPSSFGFQRVKTYSTGFAPVQFQQFASPYQVQAVGVGGCGAFFGY